MHSTLSFFLGALMISVGPSAMSKSDLAAALFTLQVASFPDTAQANKFAGGLLNAGEHPAFDTVEIEGRGYWTRVFVGLFDTTDAARRYGVQLIARGIIKEFLVKKASLNQAVTRPRRVAGTNSQVSPVTGGSALVTKRAASSLRTIPIYNGRALGYKSLRDAVHTGLPVVKLSAFRLAPMVNTSLIPRPDPVTLAFKLVTGEVRHAPAALRQPGGLWVSGDTAEGMARLRWIVGEENAGLIKLDADGRVRFDTKLLAKAAGSGTTRVQDPLHAVKYISSNEGLLLLVQVALGRYRYLLHIGRQAPTYGKSVETAGSLNLDNNVDSRINPHRKNGKKVDAERPPEGFDSLIALNPVARWFNLSANCWVHPAEIVFHELAEAHAKVEFCLDYLDQGSRPGAHTLALEREQRLKSQRPGADIVITTGSNRLLRTEDEIRLFTAEASAGANQQ